MSSINFTLSNNNSYQFDLEQTRRAFKALTDGTHNMGELRFDRNGALEIVNNHVFLQGSNNTVLEEAENETVRRALMGLVDQTVTHDRVKDAVRNILLGANGENCTKSLTREVARQILNAAEANISGDLAQQKNELDAILEHLTTNVKALEERAIRPQNRPDVVKSTKACAMRWTVNERRTQLKQALEGGALGNLSTASKQLIREALLGGAAPANPSPEQSRLLPFRNWFFQFKSHGVDGKGKTLDDNGTLQELVRVVNDAFPSVEDEPQPVSVEERPIQQQPVEVPKNEEQPVEEPKVEEQIVGKFVWTNDVNVTKADLQKNKYLAGVEKILAQKAERLEAAKSSYLSACDSLCEELGPGNADTAQRRTLVFWIHKHPCEIGEKAWENAVLLAKEDILQQVCRDDPTYEQLHGVPSLDEIDWENCNVDAALQRFESILDNELMSPRADLMVAKEDIANFRDSERIGQLYADAEKVIADTLADKGYVDADGSMKKMALDRLEGGILAFDPNSRGFDSTFEGETLYRLMFGSEQQVKDAQSGLIADMRNEVSSAVEAKRIEELDSQFKKPLTARLQQCVVQGRSMALRRILENSVAAKDMEFTREEIEKGLGQLEGLKPEDVDLAFKEKLDKASNSVMAAYADALMAFSEKGTKLPDEVLQLKTEVLEKTFADFTEEVASDIAGRFYGNSSVATTLNGANVANWIQGVRENRLNEFAELMADDNDKSFYERHAERFENLVDKFQEKIEASRKSFPWTAVGEQLSEDDQKFREGLLDVVKKGVMIRLKGEFVKTHKADLNEISEPCARVDILLSGVFGVFNSLYSNLAVEKKDISFGKVFGNSPKMVAGDKTSVQKVCTVMRREMLKMLNDEDGIMNNWNTYMHGNELDIERLNTLIRTAAEGVIDDVDVKKLWQHKDADHLAVVRKALMDIDFLKGS